MTCLTLMHYIVLPFLASQTAENSSHASSSYQSKNPHLAFLAFYLTHGIPPLQLDYYLQTNFLAYPAVQKKTFISYALSHCQTS